MLGADSGVVTREELGADTTVVYIGEIYFFPMLKVYLLNTPMNY